MQILPNHVALFGISIDQFGGKSYLPYTKIITDDFTKKKGLYFRLQYKSLECGTLRKEDPVAFAYYLLQVSVWSPFEGIFLNGKRGKVEFTDDRWFSCLKAIRPLKLICDGKWDPL